jgi:hypothetical protein
MLKEYLSEAVSLLAEAVLGESTKVLAGCPYQEYRHRYDECGSCGDQRRWHYYEKRTCDPCFGYCTPWYLISKNCVVCS